VARRSKFTGWGLAVWHSHGKYKNIGMQLKDLTLYQEEASQSKRHG
jgi:hypothetical protein